MRTHTTLAAAIALVALGVVGCNGDDGGDTVPADLATTTEDNTATEGAGPGAATEADETSPAGTPS